MRMFLKFVIPPILACLVWGGMVFWSAASGWFHSPIAPSDNAAAFSSAAKKVIDEQAKGNVAYILIEDGVPVDSHYLSAGKAVDGETLFQVASLSKWVSAWGVMTLVENGQIDLDEPVSKYLTRWQLPASEYDNDGVTVRRLLSHTAGLTDGLGYGGFLSVDDTQTLEQSLTKAADASPGKSGEVRVGVEPGSEWIYSGGGYTLLQLIIEEVSGTSFENYMQTSVFNPLGMNRSTFTAVDKNTPNLAEFYDASGNISAHYRFSGLAPTSLYTTASDLTRFIQAHFDTPSGPKAGRGLLSSSTLDLMRSPHAATMGIHIWGLGVMLYAPNGEGSYVIGHDGNNDPAINTTARFNPSTRDGIIILETGNKTLATEIAGEWTFLQTGIPDFLMFTLGMPEMYSTMQTGWFVILAITLLFGVKTWIERKQ